MCCVSSVCVGEVDVAWVNVLLARRGNYCPFGHKLNKIGNPEARFSNQVPNFKQYSIV